MKKKRPMRWLLRVALGVALVPVNATADSTCAIKNARIVTVTGPVIEKGSVVMRDGLIVAVGENIPIPAEAIVVDGAGLHVYPGLIDAHTHFGLPRARGEPQQTATPEVPQPGPAFGQQAVSTGPRGVFEPDRTNDASNYLTPPPRGFSPELVVAHGLQPSNEKATMLGAGVTTVLAAPREGVLRGQSALVNLGSSDGPGMIVRTPAALHLALAGGGGFGAGNYPGSQLGIIAALRQAFTDAQWYAARKAQWEKHGDGASPAHPTHPSRRPCRRRWPAESLWSSPSRAPTTC